MCSLVVRVMSLFPFMYGAACFLFLYDTALLLPFIFKKYRCSVGTAERPVLPALQEAPFSEKTLAACLVVYLPSKAKLLYTTIAYHFLDGRRKTVHVLRYWKPREYIGVSA
jgi:hypothetical protein